MRNTLPRLRPIVVLSDPIERAMERYAMESVESSNDRGDDTNAANYGGVGECAKT